MKTSTRKRRKRNITVLVLVAKRSTNVLDLVLSVEKTRKRNKDNLIGTRVVIDQIQDRNNKREIQEDNKKIRNQQSRIQKISNKVKISLDNRQNNDIEMIRRKKRMKLISKGKKKKMIEDRDTDRHTRISIDKEIEMKDKKIEKDTEIQKDIVIQKEANVETDKGKDKETSVEINNSKEV